MEWESQGHGARDKKALLDSTCGGSVIDTAKSNDLPNRQPAV
jgi:hypothetical protein